MNKKKYSRSKYYYGLGDFLNKTAGAIGTIGENIAEGASEIKGVDTSQQEAQARALANQQITASSTADLLNQWNQANFLNNVNKYDITGGSVAGDIVGSAGSFLKDVGQGALAGSSIVPGIGTIVGAAAAAVGNVGKQIFRGINTKNNINRLNNTINLANSRMEKSYNDAAYNLNKQQTENLLAAYAALGGPLFAEGGGIHIKPSKRGTFTAAATKHGKSVQAFASQVLANKEDYSPAMVKKANFARNAAKWHADGGTLLSNDFTNGVTFINQGGTHENNPHEGVQMGIAPDGAPNLVEEGEVIFNDYVFSNRLRVPKEVRNKYKLRGPKDMTFAEAFKEAQKESQERPNDPISQDGLNNIAMILARTQEAVRGYNEAHRKAKGGHIYSGIEPIVEENIVEPELQADINAFWKSKLGDKWYSPKERRAYMEADPTNAAYTEPRINSELSALRFADPLATLGAVTSDALGLTNTAPVFNYIPGYKNVGYTPISNYIPVTHFDTRYTANKAAQQAAATRDAIMQSSSPNKWQNLLAADYNAQIAEGEALRQGALQEYETMLQREQFNRGTNQANSEMGLKAAMADSEFALKYAQSMLQQAKMNDDMSNLASAARAQNIGNLAESIANSGRERDAINWRDMLIRAGVFGTQSEKPSGWTDKEWKAYKNLVNDVSAYGGTIKKKKKGLTY